MQIEQIYYIGVAGEDLLTEQQAEVIEREEVKQVTLSSCCDKSKLRILERV